MSEVLLMEAARADLVTNLVRPALAAGRVVLCDRYDDSTLAYQGAGRGLEPGLLAILNRAATGGLKPALTLLYDVPPGVGLARRGSAGGDTNRLDREPADFHARVRARASSSWPPPSRRAGWCWTPRPRRTSWSGSAGPRSRSGSPRPPRERSAAPGRAGGAEGGP